jgi:hypothetical protein
MNRLPDPRFTTSYGTDYRGLAFHEQNTYLVSPLATEKFCAPGYQPQRPNKGKKLLINNFYFHPSLQYGGPNWAQVVYTPMPTDN